jgi:anti-sigma B factor antagonist
MSAPPPAPLDVATQREGDLAVLLLTGELDPHTAPVLEAAIAEAAGSGATALALDLAGVRFIDSSGLRVILAARQEGADAGRPLTVRSPSPNARRLLEITGLLDHLEVSD